MMGVPTFYTRLLANPGFTREVAAGVRVFICGSAPLLPTTFAEFEERTGQRILERYGMSEAVIITTNPLDGERIAGSVGYPLPGVELRIGGGEEETGVIQIRGPSVFSAYWRMPEPERRAREEKLRALPRAWATEPAPDGERSYETQQAPLYYWLLAPADRLTAAPATPKSRQQTPPSNAGASAQQAPVPFAEDKLRTSPGAAGALAARRDAAPSDAPAALAKRAQDSATVSDEAQSRTVDEWIRLIRRLKAEGRNDLAAKELAAFRTRYQERAEALLPADLRDAKP
jgi:acyl-CoA synthetase (AMP-forming)/AMP-acid ligase II